MMTPSQRWSALEPMKLPFVTRAEKYALWTLPYVFPYAGYNGQLELDADWDSIGAQAVNHLANKIMLALFAPARPFFRMDADDEGMARLVEEYGVDEVKIKLMFSRAEKEAMKRLVAKSGRTALFALVKALIITGNGMLYIPPQKKVVTYSLRDYVVQRSQDGTIKEIIVKELIVFGKLDSGIQEEILQVSGHHEATTDVELWTWVTLNNEGKYDVVQYAKEALLPDTRGVYTEETLPWIPATWNLQRGMDYATGHVEDYSGEFHAIEVLNQAIIEGAALACEHKLLVNPNGVADVEELNNAENGDYVWGHPDDVKAIDLGSPQKWQELQSVLKPAEQRVGRGFLMNSAVTRDAERVTAEEIRTQAMELETALGGTYSHLAETVQTPVAYNVLEDLDLANLKGVRPLIVTGMDSLSRGSEHEQFMMWMNDLGMLNNIPEDVRAITKLDSVMAKMATGRGVEFEDVIKSPEEQKADQQRQMQQQQQMMQAEAQAKGAAQPQ